MSESQRLEPRWRCIKEGEVSAYKIVLCLFIRENFLVNPLLQIANMNTATAAATTTTTSSGSSSGGTAATDGGGGGEQPQQQQRPPLMEKNLSPRTLLLIYKLITTNDMPFSKLKSLIEDPTAQVRPEVLRKFMKIISNLEDGSVGFLYELFHSIIDIKSSQIIVLRKKVEKSSPFGKFLRIVLMNLRRMSYPQVHYLYRQVCGYVGDFVKMRKKSVGIIATTTTPIVKDLGDTTVSSPLSEVAASAVVTTPTNKSFKTLRPSHHHQQPNPYKFRGLEIFQRMIDRSRKGTSSSSSSGFDLFTQYTTEYKRATGKWNLAQERELQKSVEDKKRRIAVALEGTKSLRNSWQPNPLCRSASQASLDSVVSCDDIMDTSGSIERPSAPKRRSGGGGGFGSSPAAVPTRTLPPRSPRKSRGGVAATSAQVVTKQELNMLGERDDGYFPGGSNLDVEMMAPPSTPPPSLNISSSPHQKSSSNQSPRSSNNKSKGGKGPRTPSKKSPQTTPQSTVDASPASSTTSTITDSKVDRLLLINSKKELPASKKYEGIKWWSRKQIERALKALASELLKTSKYSYSPKAVSTFVEMAVLNPSAQILLSQIHFVEYLNCIRLKDIRRCTESLRTSFDVRIKPNTSELNKGVPYAPYNFAVFYNFMGYKKDAVLCLEEAFRAGHAAADPTCLHYCHNMWSYLQNKPYTDAIVTVTKEVDNNMAYLHSLNVVANAFDYHYQRQPPEEVLYTLWHYNAECDLEEMESLLLLSLSSFFMAFGWHEMATIPCQIILNSSSSSLKWPLKAYCKALIVISDALLFRGETDIPVEIMEYGEKLFQHDASSVGEMFSLRHAVFKAFHAYLGYRAVPEEVLGTLGSFSRVEGCYWLAYTKMIQNEWEQALNLLNVLSKLLQEAEISCENNDMKMRCLLLMAELQCLSGAPAAALGHIFEALDIAYSYCADHFVTLCLTHIASIQCQLGLPTTASKTLHKEMRSAIRSSNPWLNARIDVVSVRINIQLLHSSSESKINRVLEYQLMGKLDKAEELYLKWGNGYRVKEICWLRAELLEKCGDGDDDCGGGGDVGIGGGDGRKKRNPEEYREMCEGIKSCLLWGEGTCLM